MAKKYIDTAKLMGSSPKKKVKKVVQDTEEAINAIHKPRTIRTSLDIPEDIHKRIKLLAVQRGVSMKNLMLQFFAEGLAGME